MYLFEAAILRSVIVFLGLHLLLLLLLLLVLLLFLLLLLLPGLWGTTPADCFLSLLQVSQSHTLEEERNIYDYIQKLNSLLGLIILNFITRIVFIFAPALQ